MSAMSDYLENEILDHILGTGAYTAPTTVYVGRLSMRRHLAQQTTARLSSSQPQQQAGVQ